MELSAFDNIRIKIGICLALCGVPLAMLLNFLIPITPWSPIIMLLSALCLFDGFRNVGNTNSRYLTIILLFQLLMLVYWFFDDKHEFKYLSFHLFIIAFCFVIRNNEKIRECEYLTPLCIYSGTLSIIFAVLEYQGYFSFDFWYELGKVTASERTLEVFTANTAAYTNLVACLLLFDRENSKSTNIFLLLLCAVDLYVINYSGKRSFFVASVFSICYMLYKTKAYKYHLPQILVGLVLTIALIPQVQNSFVELFNNTVSGFLDVYRDKTVEYDENSSSAIRAYNLAAALDDLKSYNITQLIFGKGYLAHFIDNPLFESYLDMGFMGILFYFIITVYIPIKTLFKNMVEDKYATLALLLVLMHTFICITNNNPYSYFAYTPAILLALYNNKDYIDNDYDNH